MKKESVLLDKNENLYGPTPKTYEVLKNLGARDLVEYSRHSIGEIEQALEKKWGYPKEKILLGYGSEDLLKMAMAQFVQKGDTVLLPSHSWWYYSLLVERRGANSIYYPSEREEHSYKTDLEALYTMQTSIKSPFIMLSTPNNPTGHSFDLLALEELFYQYPQTFFCIDETYWGYSETDSTPTILALMKRHENLFVIRSLSKFYALSGVRVGWAFSSESIQKSMKFYERALGFNRISEKLALCALEDTKYYTKIGNRIQEDRTWLFQKLNQLEGITAYHSQANFLLLQISDSLRKPLQENLKTKGFQIKFFEDNLSGFARLTLGRREQNIVILETLQSLCSSFVSDFCFR